MRALRRKWDVMLLCRIALLIVIATYTCARAFAEIRLPHALSDHAVLQRGVPIHIWGWGTPETQVTVMLHDQSAHTSVDRLGKWNAWLQPESAGGPYSLTVTESDSDVKVALSDILIGDVWLASGQSNMEMPLEGFGAFSAPIKDGPAEIKAATHARIRLLHIYAKSSDYPLNDIDESWTECNPDTAKGFSAAAYFFGREISERENVPIGLIDAAWGGVPVDSFMSLESLTANSAVLPALAYRAQYEKELADYPAIVAAEKREDDAAKAAGKTAPQHDWHPDGSSWLPSGPYNAMIAPITNYTLKGFLWYQGESDTSTVRASHYFDLFSALIFDWRRQFAQGDLPFLYAQISSFSGDGGWGVVRDAQRRTLALRDTAMAVTLDVGDRNVRNIHPPDKQSVGARLALAARGMVYGEHIEYQGPLFREATTQPGAMRVWFDHAEGLNVRTGKVEGFEVAGTDHRFVPAEASIKGSTIVVMSNQVSDPKYVRYAWYGTPPPSLYNAAGLPASTFTSESIPQVP
jgi:sialate O-acetylesterase